MPKFLILLLILFLSLPGFTQEETEKAPLSEGGGTVTIRETAPSEPVAEPNAPAAAPVEEDETLRQLEAEQKARMEKMKMIQQSTEAMKPKNPVEELKKLGHSQLNAAALLDEKVVAYLQQTLKEGGMSKVPPEQVRKMLQEKMKGHFMESVVQQFPKLLDIFVDVLRDKDAMPGLLNIFKRKDDLKTYGYLWLAIFVFGMWFKGRIIKPKWPFLRRFKYSSIVSLVLTSSTIYLFYSMFNQELSPTLAIVGKHLF